MNNQSQIPTEVVARVVERVAKYKDDPLNFVRTMYPWGEPGAMADSPGPYDWQADILGQIRDSLARDPHEPIRIAVASGHGIGKLVSDASIIPTPRGDVRHGDLRPGDVVFDADGSPTTIRQVHHFHDVPMYRVTFDDGSYSDVSSGHLWTVRGRSERRNNLDSWRTMETIQILDYGVKRRNGQAMSRQWEIPIQGPAEFDEREIDIHPYLMGVWLGDGHKGQPRYTKPYDEVADKIRSLGYEVTDEPDGSRKYIKGITHLMGDPVFQCGSHERYIPDDYKFNTVANRMALLEGLCDTDGEVHGAGSIGYATTSKRLADDVIWLARSLGCKAMMQPTVKHGWYPDADGERVECRDCWRVTINAPFNPFTIEHRRERYKPSESRYMKRWIDDIEPIANAAHGMCITVDNSDGLYQANDFIVTHNSSMVAWLCDWAISTMPDARGVVTANTDAQLKTKTWPELTKWHGMCETSPYIRVTATAMHATVEGSERTWRIDAIPWSETRTESFAGLHNRGRRVLMIYDEASSIADVIWEVSEGAMTDTNTQIIWVVFGNPTRNTGRFRECFGRMKHRWKTYQIDSREVPGTNKDQIQQWIEDYGDDSDFVRVRVKGEFPRAGSMQFISSELIHEAANREPVSGLHDPIIMGVDVARYGDDECVIVFRRGLDASTHEIEKYRGLDLMTFAGVVASKIERHVPDAVFIDETGIGAGVVDRLKQLGHDVIGVNFGSKASGAVGDEYCANKRAEMWAKMKQWLKDGGSIPNDPDLIAQLEGLEYGYDHLNRIQLEKKDDMKKRGLSSPDWADALCLTWAHPVAQCDRAKLRGSASPAMCDGVKDYDPFGSLKD